MLSLIRKWSPDEDDILIRLGKYSYLDELCLLIVDRTYHAIRGRLRYLGISALRRHTNKVSYNLSIKKLDNIIRQIIIGGMLGDGSVTSFSRSENSRYVEGHGPKQKEYVIWKDENLGDFSSYISKTKTVMHTISHPIFTNIRKRFYGGGSFKVCMPSYYIGLLDELGLLIWYLDDGSIYDNIPTLHCGSMPFSEVEKSVIFLNRKFNLGFTPYTKRSNKESKLDCYSFIKIGSRNGDRDKLFRLWNEFFKKHKIPICMKYKLEKKPVKFGNILWTKEEDKILTIRYKQCKSCDEILQFLPGRTISSIRNRIKRLKLKKINSNKWTVSDDNFIKDNLDKSDRWVAFHLGRKAGSVSWRRKQIGFKKKTWNTKPSYNVEDRICAG